MLEISYPFLTPESAPRASCLFVFDQGEPDQLPGCGTIRR